LALNVPQGTHNWNANFQWKRSEVNITGRQKPKNIATYLAYVYLRVTDQALAAGAPTAN